MVDFTESVLRELRSVREQHEARTRELVARAVRAGAKSDQIARSLSVSRARLWRDYAGELRRDAGRRGSAGRG